ncbi:MAG TPA: YkgJ family cysteine cluster protein, partial [Cellulomonadaceae bacterium]|nr:YkgJ family cysteine cluster protein [Cellulomonadaceae bacterium]
CGNCCDPVTIDADAIDPWRDWLDYWRAGGVEDVTDSDGDPADPTYRFIAEHMTEISNEDGVVSFACSFFDKVTRQCGAYDQRPPMCSNYPWYGDEPADRIAKNPYQCVDGCSFLLDVPPGARPEGSRPFIPLTVVRSTP